MKKQNPLPKTTKSFTKTKNPMQKPKIQYKKEKSSKKKRIQYKKI